MSKKFTTEYFIKRARKVHGNYYDYSKVSYINSHINIINICPKHGEFPQLPYAHLNGDGCPICAGNQKSTTEEFIIKARKVHGDYYDYSKVDYINNHTEVIIICPEDGKFPQTPDNHLRGQGCPKCGLKSGSLKRTITTEEFIIRARKVHGDYYDYSKVDYINSYTDVINICPEHGEFPQNPTNHLAGSGCPKCSTTRNTKYTTEEFIIRARKTHGNTYDYSKVDYVNNHTAVTIICPIDGEFEQLPIYHINSECGCPKCAARMISNKQRSTTEEFIIKARKIYGNLYDYSKVDYINNSTDVIIICPEDGEFPQAPNAHLAGHGCPKCGLKKLRDFNKKNRTGTEEFIIRAKKIHGSYYNYDKVDYKGAHIDVIITCPKDGDFPQSPHAHLAGQGCPICQASHGERSIAQFLDNKNIKYIRQKRFKDCINPKTKRKLSYDFCLDEYNTLIEFNGQQHYRYAAHWHQNGKTLADQKYRDRLKRKYALSYGYRFIVIKYTDNIEEKLQQILRLGKIANEIVNQPKIAQ